MLYHKAYSKLMLCENSSSVMRLVDHGLIITGDILMGGRKQATLYADKLCGRAYYDSTR